MNETRCNPDPEVLLRHTSWVQKLARSMIVDRNEAEDVIQDTWLAALRHPPRNRGNLRSWLAKIRRWPSLHSLSLLPITAE
jgi:DNA-directed RNA polymerase specialized sigma24 family protein